MSKIKYYFIKTVLFVVFFASVSIATDKKSNVDTRSFFHEDLAVSFAIINDNYIAKWKKDENGNYFGADDFLTASLITCFYWDSWKTAVLYNSITSRKFNFRYDLLTATISKSFFYDWIIIQPEFGLMMKGNLGGDGLQNGYHALRALNTVNFPYSKKKGFSLIAGIDGLWKKDNLLFSNDALTASVEGRLLTDFVPSRSGLTIGYQFSLWNFAKFELLANGRFYINTRKEYSEMIRSGVITALNLKIKTYKDFFFDVGFALFPTKNLQSDPRFPKYRHNYLPQFWMVFSWNTAGLSLRDYIDY